MAVFDYGQTILSIISSSAYKMLDGSLLISYAYADGGNNARLVGLNSAHDVVFDFQYPNLSGCSTSWNAQGTSTSSDLRRFLDPATHFGLEEHSREGGAQASSS